MSIILSLIIFCLLITVHELGHYVAARKCGVGVKEFAIGMGPAIFKRERNGIIYSLRIIPMGGYCLMEGEDAESDKSDAFGNRPIWARFIVLVSGALMNILMCFVIFAVIMCFTDTIHLPVVDALVPDAPAQVAGIQPGDTITHIGKTRINIQKDAILALAQNRDKPTTVTVKRGDERLTFDVTPMLRGNTYIIGYSIVPIAPTLTQRAQEVFYETVLTGKIILISLSNMVTGNVSLNDMRGPVGIIEEVGAAAKSSVLDVLYLTALITINLGIFNLLPLPALDGGRILFLLIELVRRKKVSAKVEGTVHMIGFALLIVLLIVVTSNDLRRIIMGFFT